MDSCLKERGPTHQQTDYPMAGSPILTMDRRPSAVLTAVLAGRAAPSVAQLWALYEEGPDGKGGLVGLWR